MDGNQQWTAKILLGARPVRSIRFILVIFLLLSMPLRMIGNQFFKQEEKQNIERFSVAAYPIATESADSIMFVLYMNIPHNALQFVKKDSGFVAKYEASMAITNDDGIQLKRRIWVDSVKVENYILTMSRIESVTLFDRFMAPLDHYWILGQVIDQDTRNTGESKKEWNAEKYRSDVSLFPLFILTEGEETWGFAQGLIPAFQNVINEISGGLPIFYSGRVQPGAYAIKATVENKDGDVLWVENKSYETSEHYFRNTLTIPVSVLASLSMNLRINLTQNDVTKSESLPIRLSKPGISRMIQDVDDALDQMTYILKESERHELERANAREREDLFKTFWKTRDPTPHTLQNELMDEYYRRVEYANTHFTGFQDGWLSDMGMIYILFGPPDDVDRTTSLRSQRVYEVWYYHRINQQFLFIDMNGFGDFRLDSPFIDPRLRSW